MEIKRNLLIFIDHQPDKSDGRLRFRIRYNGIKVDFNVGYRVDPDKWNKQDQRCKRGTTHGKGKVSATEINKEIQRLDDKANDIFKIYEVKDIMPSADEFRKAFNKDAGKDNKVTTLVKTEFFSKLDEFIRTSSHDNQWQPSTIEKFTVLKKHLLDHNPAMTFEYLNETGLNRFYLYLRDTKKMRSSTTKKQITLLKWFMKWATFKGYNTNTAFTGFSPKIKHIPPKVIFLTWEEVMKVYNFKIPKSLQPRLEKIKDVFLFSLFTGLRYSDFIKLKKSDIRENSFEVLTQKTTDPISVDLNQYSREILHKYKDFHFEKDLALPTISADKTNKYERELCELAGIDEPIKIAYYQGTELVEKTVPKHELITSKIGRKTFISNSLRLGIPENVIRQWTGHASIEAMKPYMGTDKDQLSREMNKWNDNKQDELKNQLKQLTKEQLTELLNVLNV